MNSELKKTVIIGSGNLAEALARAVAKSELELVQIFARNAERARVVAELAATGWEACRSRPSPNDSPGVPFSIRCRPSPEGAKRTFP